jgi:hypothetical protein
MIENQMLAKNKKYKGLKYLKRINYGLLQYIN